MKAKGRVIGVVIILLVVAAGLGYKFLPGLADTVPGLKSVRSFLNFDFRKPEALRGAVGGGKENLLGDADFARILKSRFKLLPANEPWSNSKLIKDDVSSYDFLFFSDQRFFDYYKQAPDQSKGEAARKGVLKGGMTLNTPIVIYSWDKVVEALAAAGLVREKDGVQYLTGLDKLLEMILKGAEWKSLGLEDLYGKINIASTDPVTSSPGATYYGLLVSVMNGGSVDAAGLEKSLPRLKAFYDKSGYMNQSPADLFENYLRQGMGARPMIVDYEKSIIDFAARSPELWAQIKDRVRILYPAPTIWNSHCVAALTPRGERYLAAFDSGEIQDIAWKRYGFRTGLSGGSYKVADIPVPGIPAAIDAVVPALPKGMYDAIISYLGKKD
jgi:hypothetical protein